MPNYFRPISEASVPFYDALKNFEWVPSFLRCEEIHREIRAIKKERDLILELPPDLESFIEHVRVSFEEHQRKRVDRITTLLCRAFNDRLRQRNPLNNWDRDDEKARFAPFVTWEEIELALSQIKAIPNTLKPKGGLISDTKREEKLSDLKARTAALTAELAENSPQGYFLLKSGAVRCDARQEFFAHWWSLQHKMNAACGPQGFVLSRSSEAERQAYRDLGISEGINESSHIHPHPEL